MGRVLAYSERGTPVLFVFCPWNSEEFRARVAAAKLMNILWAKDPGVQKIMANNEKRIPPWLSSFFFWGGMKHYTQLCGDSITRTPIQQPGFNGKFLRVFFEAQVSIVIPMFFDFRMDGSHGGSLIPDHWDISTFDSLNVVGFPFHRVFPLSCSCYKCL